MDDRKGERLGVLGGVVFVVLDVAVAVMGGEPPPGDAGAAVSSVMWRDLGAGDPLPGA